MKKHYINLFLFLSLCLSGCNFKGENTQSDRPKSPEELRLELRTQEQSNPLDYISTDQVTMKHNQTREEGIFNSAEYDGYLIQGNIKNTASIAKFKDVVLTINFLSQTGTIIEKNEKIIYEFYEPNSSKPFTIKVYPPEATSTFNVTLKNAASTE